MISGRVLAEDSSARVAGKSRVLVNFDSVRLPNGQSYRFSGLVNGVITSDGDNVTVAQQTPIRQTRNNAGSILGALIGAVTGQPIEQSATGVSGTILTEPRDVFGIGTGSQFIITATTDTTTANRLR